MRSLIVKDLKRLAYPDAVSFQERILRLRQEGKIADTLLLVEHPHVFTLGRSGKEKHLLDPGMIPIHRTSRGGDITYHGPGQLVAYPVINLRSKLRKEVHLYLYNLEWITIETLKAFGIGAERKPPWTGVWIGRRKIASVGVAVSKGVTYHGLALNVNPDLTYFDRIIPCGLSWAKITSMERELKKPMMVADVQDEFVRNFVAQFDYTELEKQCPEDIRTGSRLKPLEVPTTSVSNGF
jgi:lipoate-protein ligase B